MRDKVEDIRQRMRDTELRLERWSRWRPVVLGILGAMALLLALWWSFVREESEAVRQPLEENIMEPSEMREDVTEEVDDTEHLYLEQ